MRVPREDLPVAVIGAGPVGLVAAAHLLHRGQTPLVLEAGERVGQSVREWGHVRLFSPWRYVVDPVARAMLEEEGWSMPGADALPDGDELVRRWLEPLAAHPRLRPHVHPGRRVVSAGRLGYDRMKTAGRERAPFELTARGSDGAVHRYRARAVIDASGTWTGPNPLGAAGNPAEGEAEHRGRIRYGIPDVLGDERGRYAGKRTLVVGSGHSAFNALLDLSRLAREAAGTEVLWAIRGSRAALFGSETRDQLEARGELGARLRRLLDSGEIRLVQGFRTTGVTHSGRGLLLRDGADRVIGPVDEIVAATGFRPDLSITRELRLRLDDRLEAPERLAPLIDPDVHSCGTVYPHGAAELGHPERDFYTVGMKSYGRAPTFLLLTGYEQVRSVVAKLTGDEEGAARVQLTLPETGACSTPRGQVSPCCGPTPDRLPDPRSPPAAAPAPARPLPGRWRADAARDGARESSGCHRAAGSPTPIDGGDVTHANDAARESQGPNAPAPAACCSEPEQATCCLPAEKPSCCSAQPAPTCGCK